MRIAVLSDTHDNVWKLAVAMPHLAAADVILHCGDLCSPFVVKQLAEGVGETPLHIVWGNNDGDKMLLKAVANNSANFHIHAEFASLQFDGIKVAMTHYPEIGKALSMSSEFDLVCYGHDHTAHLEKKEGVTLLNPGEVMGLNGRSSMAMVLLPEMKVEWI